MDNRKDKFIKSIKNKKAYFSAALAFAAVISSVAISYYASGGNIDITTTEPKTIFTLPAEAEKNDIPDERTTEAPDDTETKKAETTSSVSQTVSFVQTTEAKPVNREYVLPLGGAVTKWFSIETQQYSKTMGDWRVHLGVDFSGTEGEDVRSIGNGKVTKVISDTKWGYIIEIDYGDFTARYCGISQDGAVGKDRKVTAGEVIGKLSAIPCESLDGAHLHLETIKDGANIDPMKAMELF